MTKTLMIILILLLLVSCLPVSQIDPSDDREFARVIHRWYDREAGVVCWVLFSSRTGGLDCMPIEDTNLSWPNVMETR